MFFTSGLCTGLLDGESVCRVRVLVTGCCGFIGSRLAAYLGCRGYNVYGLDNLSRAIKGSMKKL